MDEEFDDLVNTIGLEERGISFREDFHPVEIAIDLVNYNALETISKHIERNDSLKVTTKLFSKALESTSSRFKKAIIQAFFSPPGLSTDSLPTALAIPDTEFPYIYKCGEKDLGLKNIREIEDAHKDADKHTYQYYRISEPISVHLTSDFIKNFLLEMQENSELCAGTQAKNVVLYLWKNYKFYAWIYALFFIAFSVISFLGLIWCTTKDKCETFLNTGSLTGPLLIIIWVTMYSLYLVFLVLEALVLYKIGLAYFRNFNNIIDSVILLLYLPITILIFTGVLDEGQYITNNI